MYISLFDIGLFVLFIAVIVMAGYIIAVLHRLLCIMGCIKQLFTEHGDDIDELFSILPKTIADVGSLAATLSSAVERIGDTLVPLKDDVVDTVDDLRGELEMFLVYARMVVDLIRALFSK